MREDAPGGNIRRWFDAMKQRPIVGTVLLYALIASSCLYVTHYLL